MPAPDSSGPCCVSHASQPRPVPELVQLATALFALGEEAAQQAPVIGTVPGDADMRRCVGDHVLDDVRWQLEQGPVQGHCPHRSAVRGCVRPPTKSEVPDLDLGCGNVHTSCPWLRTGRSPGLARPLDIDGLADAEPDTMRFRLYRLPARLADRARRRWLRIDATWPRATALTTCWQRLTVLAAVT